MNIKHTQGRAVKVACDNSNCNRQKTVIARKPIPRLRCRHCGGQLRER